mmetsp:Transcript_10647/g.19993  ORF Transcript_10647/g.19993 Transcript_10647/m.19993 type:complete len:1116 (-) Transcript_10647:2460-5807(-)
MESRQSRINSRASRASTAFGRGRFNSRVSRTSKASGRPSRLMSRMTSAVTTGTGRKRVEIDEEAYAGPELKVEVLSRRSIRTIFVYLSITLSLNFVSLAMICALSNDWVLVVGEGPGNPDPTSSNRTENLALLFLQGFCYILATLVVLFLIVAYPRRIVLHSCVHNVAPLPEQVMVMVMTVFVCISPLFFIGGMTSFISSAVNAERAASSTPYDDFVMYLLLNQQKKRHSDTFLAATVVTFMLFFWGTLVHLQGSRSRKGDIEAVEQVVFENLEKHHDNKGLKTSSLDTDDLDEEERRLLTRMKRTDKRLKNVDMVHKRHALEKKAKKIKLDMAWLCGKLCCWQLWCRCPSGCRNSRMAVFCSGFKLVGQGMALQYVLLLLVHWCSLLVLSLSFDFEVSVIPFVSMITVLRVCVADNTSNCAPGAYDGLPFKRAIAISCLFIVEVIVFKFNFQLILNTRKALSMLPYAQGRGIHLGFNFFQSVTFITWGAILLFSTIIVSVPNVNQWITKFDSSYTVVIKDPLFTCGVNGTNMGFSSIFLLFSDWLFILSACYLPSDSVGFRGWFFPSKSNEHFLNVEQPPYFGLEVELDAMRHYEYDEEDCHETFDGENTMVELPPIDITERDAHVQDSCPSNSVDDEVIRIHRLSDFKYTVDHSALFLNSIVMERVIRMLNYSTITYKLKRQKKTRTHVRSHTVVTLNNNLKSISTASHKRSATYAAEFRGTGRTESEESDIEEEGGEDESDTEEEEEGGILSFLEDTEYEFLAHIEDKKTDTHLLVVYSKDEVIVSFRGSVSQKNFATDLNYKLVEHPLWPNYSAKGTKKKMLVHTGFLEAYESIRSELHSVVDNLLVADGDQIRALYCTGHSLGGACSIFAAFDFSSYILREANFMSDLPAVSCTTFGCPKVGNSAFKEAFEAQVFCKRIVVKGDPVVKTPFNTLTLGGKYVHVGLELFFDDKANMIISPSIVERSSFNGFLKLSATNHLLSRYSLSILLWCVAVHKDILNECFWVNQLNLILRGCKKQLRLLPAHLAELVLGVLYHREGVEFERDKKKYRNMGTEMDPEISMSTNGDIEDIIDKLEAGTRPSPDTGDVNIDNIKQLLEDLKASVLDSGIA